MDVQIVSREIIKPSSPTPHHLKNFKLSFLDQIQSYASFYVPITLFYNTKFDLSNVSEILGRLKKSLSETLTLFYPLAGRLKNLFAIDCNDEGALYTEAKAANITLSQFLHEPDLNLLNKFLPCNTNVHLENVIQISIQVTVLGCGGLVIGACVFHRAADIATIASFLKTWADFFHGKGGDRYIFTELGSKLFPPLSTFSEDYVTKSKNNIFQGLHKYHNSRTRRFVFDASAIATLRAKATSKAVPKPSRVEVLTGFICDRLMAGHSKLSKNKPPPTLVISHAVNIRRRLKPQLPSDITVFGNFLWFAAVLYTPPSEEDKKLELPDYVEMLREAFEGVNEENLRELEPESAIEVLNDFNSTMDVNSDRMKQYKFTSWCNMGFYDLDFGWGRPAWVAHMGDSADYCPTKHQFLFIEGKNAGDIELWTLSSEEDVTILENDLEFVAVTAQNPNVSL